ncbi:hypothetical protein ACFPRL_26670 [Pseudoclavibacter helvolus]
MGEHQRRSARPPEPTHFRQIGRTLDLRNPLTSSAPPRPWAAADARPRHP